MSVVVYLKNDEKSILCADTQTSCGDEKIIRTNKNNLKFNVFKNGLIIGHVGILSVTEYVCANNEWFEFKETLSKELIITKIIPKIINGLNQRGMLNKDKNGLCNMDCSLLLIHKNNAFAIYNDFSVYEINNYIALGSGADFCLPYLINAPKQNLGKYLFNMLAENCNHNCTISPPFVSINTNTPHQIKFAYSNELKI